MNHGNHTGRAAWAVLAALAAACDVPALAASAGAQTVDHGSLEEVVVTARKREESLQEVPVAITAFSQQSIQRNNFTTLKELTNSIPNVKLEGQAALQSIAMFHSRGIGTNSVESSVDPAVPVYVDGVYQGRNAAAIVDLYDIQSLEFMRGPQDSIHGRNAFAGAVTITTRTPGQEFGGRVELGAGNGDLIEVKAAIDVPIVRDRLAGSVSYLNRDFGGYFRNGTTGKRENGQEKQSLRPQLLWTPTEDVRVRLIGEYVRDRSPATTALNSFKPGSVLAAFGFQGLNYFGDGNLGIPPDPAADPFVLGRNFVNRTWYDILGLTAHVSWNTAKGNVTAIANIRDVDDDIYTDTDGTGVNLFSSERHQQYRTYSGELRYTTTDTVLGNILLGAVYFQDSFDLFQALYLGFGNRGNPAAVPPIAPVPAFTFGADPRTYQYGINGQDRESWAVFGQIDYPLTPKLTGTVGLRYSRETKEAYAYPYRTGVSDAFPTYQPSLFCPEQKKQWDAFSPRVGLDYSVTDGVMLFGFWQRGYKSGGFSTAASGNCSAFIRPFDQERVDNYEVGVKARGFDDRVQINANFFVAKYQDLQRSIVVPRPPQEEGGGFAVVISNAAAARIRGAEIEIEALLLPRLRLSASVGWLDADYRDFVADIDGDGIVTDNSSLELIYAPKWDTRFAVTYESPQGPRAGSVAVTAAVNHSSKLQTQFFNASYTDRRALTTIDANLTWTSPGDALNVTIWGRNLADEVERMQGVVIGTILNYELPTLPRTYGVTLSARF